MLHTHHTCCILYVLLLAYPGSSQGSLEGFLGSSQGLLEGFFHVFLLLTRSSHVKLSYIWRALLLVCLLSSSRSTVLQIVSTVCTTYKTWDGRTPLIMMRSRSNRRSGLGPGGREAWNTSLLNTKKRYLLWQNTDPHGRRLWQADEHSVCHYF